MTIENVAAVRQTEPKAPNSRELDGSSQATKRRETEQTVQRAAQKDGVGPSSELRFAIDQDSGQALIRIVDRVTDEVIAQLPPETALRAAEVLKSLRPGDRIA